MAMQYRLRRFRHEGKRSPAARLRYGACGVLENARLGTRLEPGTARLFNGSRGRTPLELGALLKGSARASR